MKILMRPHVDEIRGQGNGIARVIEAYFRHLPQFGIELVSSNSTKYDLVAAHAGITGGQCDIAHIHGLYWTADYNAQEWEWHVNARVIEACRNAKAITVPSDWVAESFKRDMRLSPFVVPHGIDWKEWQHDEENGGYVLYNKNRNLDACDNSILDILCEKFPQVKFVSTLPTPKLSTKSFADWPTNFKIIETGNKTPHDIMRGYVQRAGVYLSLAKETFGIGTLEAMASGAPVLGWNWGGNTTLVQHGVNGYLARPNDFDDLCEGLNYCLKHRKVLGDNGRELAKSWTWERACSEVAGVYEMALRDEVASVSVVIPAYNKSPELLKRAIESAKNQTLKPQRVIVINDGSTQYNDEIEKLCRDYLVTSDFIYQRTHNRGVAEARNYGISLVNSKYIACLDSDDWLEPTFLEVCVKELEKDRSLGIAYTSLRTHHSDGSTNISLWPARFNPDAQLTYAQKQNQVPTCNVFRREAWERAGGYKSLYCPYGADAEDAALWSAITSVGYNAKLVDEAIPIAKAQHYFIDMWKAQGIKNRIPTIDELKSRVSGEEWDKFEKCLFNYTAFGGNATSNTHPHEDWLSMYPWAKDGLHPFASVATPRRHSHPVRQYDDPAISVIIPVGPGHEKEVENALDSLEMQTFRKWEVVVVWDYHTQKESKFDKAYPYVRQITTKDKFFAGLDMITPINSNEAKSFGAGFCRNKGVEIARAPLIFFLDADDVLASPDALQKMLDAWNEQESIVYSDYLGKAVWDYEEASKKFGADLLGYNSKKGTAIFKKKAVDFNPQLAQKQPEYTGDPNNPYYHWCLVSVLVPKAWHLEIGGFDESLTTWEDVDYHWRMVKAGHCYHRVQEPLVLYSYHKGQRREKSAVNDQNSLQQHKKMIQYIRQKYEGLENKVCNCGQRKTPQTNGAEATAMSDSDFVLIQFDFPGSDTRSNYGKSLKSFTRQLDSKGRVLDYNGYGRGKGDRFLVHVLDQRARPDMFRPVPNEVKAPEVEIKPLSEPKPLATKPLAEPELFQSVVGAIEEPKKKRGRQKKS